MKDELMYILNDDKQNYAFCRFKLLVEKFGYSGIIPFNVFEYDTAIILPSKRKAVTYEPAAKSQFLEPAWGWDLFQQQRQQSSHFLQAHACGGLLNLNKKEK